LRCGQNELVSGVFLKKVAKQRVVMKRNHPGLPYMAGAFMN